ncbi:MAG TPA: hypothetical protein VFI22_14775 [Thermomicrobiales bacterium]|nr:hypothetical protein [Thermomicrobiales bacterium]
MDTQPTGTRAPGADTIPVGDRVVSETSFVNRLPFAADAGILTGQNVMTVRDRVQWGPILAGIFSAAVIFLLLTTLGLGIGASAIEPSTTGETIGTWAAVWGIVTAIIAFFIGGWVAAKTAAVGGSFAGLMNGLIVGAATLLFVIWMSVSGLGNLFGIIGANAGGIANAVTNTVATTPVTPNQAVNNAQSTANQAVNNAQTTLAQANNPSTYNAVKQGAFLTFFAFLLPIIAAGLGGLAGQNQREELISGSSAAGAPGA